MRPIQIWEMHNKSRNGQNRVPSGLQVSAKEKYDNQGNPW